MSAGYTLYDVLTKSEIAIPPTKIISISKELGFDYTALSKLGKSFNQIGDRFILSTNKDKVFTLVEHDSGKEFECVSNKSIFLHLGLPYSDNEAKYVYELKKGRQSLASIGGTVLKLKGGKEKRFRSLKNYSHKVS